MFENKYIQQRIQKADKLRELGLNPYSNKCERNTSVSKFMNVNSDLFASEKIKEMKKTLYSCRKN